MKNINKNLKKRSPNLKNKIRRISYLRLVILILLVTGIFYVTYSAIRISYNYGAYLYKTFYSKVVEVKEDINLKQFEKTETVQLESKIFTQEDIIKSLSDIILLPKEEIKIFAKVKDSEALEKESNFYIGIKKGDYLIIYPSLAIIYDAGQKKVIRSMPLN